jgi:hypothetical protein
MLAAQQQGRRVHKGMPLIWMSDCFRDLRCPLHEKRYRMLTLCEDAIQSKGEISPESTGSYHRLVWTGLREPEFRRYARRFFELAEADPKAGMFLEALLEMVDDDWLTVIPSAEEAFLYFASKGYVRHLMNQLGASGGKALETLTDYLMSCMPGCRTRRRVRSASSDYDVVCSMEGFEVDFRSELGRYFVCECKDWKDPADFATIAKFCRVLDSFKARFGILMSRSGISGQNRTTDAAREQLKVFLPRTETHIRQPVHPGRRLAGIRKGSNGPQFHPGYGGYLWASHSRSGHCVGGPVGCQNKAATKCNARAT